MKRLNCPIEDCPEYFVVDNAHDGFQNLVNEHFPGAKIFQDLKHLINRLIECCKKTSPLYVDFSKKLHGAFTGISKKLRLQIFILKNLFGLMQKFALCV